jgi:alkanesulfonate monooxygenase SsuD/methylene tetrahydromethanopterin reductase-like flavin-dependent oxidoreductase (luciferase family)
MKIALSKKNDLRLIVVGAGELADGIVTEHESPQTLRENLKDVEAGARIAGRKLEDVEVLLHVDTAVSKDFETARRAVERPLKRDIASEPFQRRRLGIKDDSREFQSLDDYRKKGMRGMSHETLMVTLDKACNQIPSDSLDDLAIAGSSDHCINQIEEYMRAGATTIIIENCGPDMLETEKVYAEKILPYFLEQRSN